MRVYKLGGPALEDPGLLPALAEELRRARGRVLVVHGGGRHVERELKARGLESRFVGGRRETSPEAMEVVEMVLSGVVNKGLAAGLTAAGLPAVGLSGRDAGLLRARLQPGLGRVGEPGVRGHARPGDGLGRPACVPVVSPVSQGVDGGRAQRQRGRGGPRPRGRPARGRAPSIFPTWTACGWAPTTVASLSADEVRTSRRARRDHGRNGDEGARPRCRPWRAGVPEVIVAGRARLVGGFPGTRLRLAGAEGTRA